MYNKQMLSVFPNFLSYWMAAPLILRAALGLALLHEGYGSRKTQRITSPLKLALGALFIIGLLVQPAALGAALLTLYEMWRHGQNDKLLFKLAIAISLLMLGPGYLAIDLPL
jgi:uncharacterized membrane protein YphA (DoxX/SURF4 family)